MSQTTHAQAQPGRLRIPLVLLLCGWALPALADELKDTGAGLEEITVTAQRRTESLQVVPISISAITGDSLDNLGIKRFSEYASMVPNRCV